MIFVEFSCLFIFSQEISTGIKFIPLHWQYLVLKEQHSYTLCHPDNPLGSCLNSFFFWKTTYTLSIPLLCWHLQFYNANGLRIWACTWPGIPYPCVQSYQPVGSCLVWYVLVQNLTSCSQHSPVIPCYFWLLMSNLTIEEKKNRHKKCSIYISKYNCYATLGKRYNSLCTLCNECKFPFPLFSLRHLRITLRLFVIFAHVVSVHTFPWCSLHQSFILSKTESGWCITKSSDWNQEKAFLFMCQKSYLYYIKSHSAVSPIDAAVNIAYIFWMNKRKS